MGFGYRAKFLVQTCEKLKELGGHEWLHRFVLDSLIFEVCVAGDTGCFDSSQGFGVSSQ